MPSRGCRPEGLKYRIEAYFGYSGRHQVHMNLQTSPPFPASCYSWKGFCGWRSILCVHCTLFVHCIYFCAYKTSQQSYFQKISKIGLQNLFIS